MPSKLSSYQPRFILEVFCLLALLLAPSLSFAIDPNKRTIVSGFARSFPYSNAITKAKITVLETGETYRTDANGNFGPIYYPVGKTITLVLEKFGYKTTQSATVIVPPEGLSGPYNNITFQVPTTTIYYLFAMFLKATIDPESCHLTATITSYHKLLNDGEQGAEGAIAVISPQIATQPFYFGIFKKGPFKGKTNPFSRELTKVSADGGIAFFNLPPSNTPYTLSAIKQGVVFSRAQFLCRKGVFINISPPQGPTVIPAS